jgi:RimJ/RimL family protein N-acetyltransferase
MSGIMGKKIILRLAEIGDAEFILNLRLRRGEFLSVTDPNLKKQIDWLKDYKNRERDGEEYYFIAELNNSRVRVGVIRAYDINYSDKTFTFGSFIIDKDNAARYSALEMLTDIFQFCFNELGLKKCFFDCRKDNDVANGFYRRYGAKVIRSDDKDIFYEYDHDLFKKNYYKYLDIIENGSSISRS